MKYLIYELFSGVGLCNQLFSFETAIYLANISNRKLILLIKNPLCHCGKATWDYGYFLNYFTNDFLNYLPHGFEVYYKKIPDKVYKIIENKKETFQFNYPDRFSQLVFVDKHLDTMSNELDIKEFCNHRTKTYLQFEENASYTCFYITQSNAGRCFYNFYTTRENYELMYHICKSIKFKDIFYDMADNIYNSMNKSQNNYNIFMHMRFGDHHKPECFLTRWNNLINKNIIPFLDGHKTNMITPKTYLLCDNSKNNEFFKQLSKYKMTKIETISNPYFNEHLKSNKMLFFDFHNVKNNSVNYAIIDMLLSVKADEFVGTLTSTFSHYIQYLRYMKNKTYDKYSNIVNGEFCKFKKQNNSNYDWVKYKYNGGHPICWHAFWNINFNKSKTLMTIHGKTDGFGSQLQAIFSLIAYCNYKGYTYVHTPMYRMQHNHENINDFVMQMNSFINIEHKFSTIDQLSNYEKSIIHEHKEGPFVHGSFSPEYFYNSYVLDLFREMYFSKQKPELYYNKDFVNIALHIRRGDVSMKNTRHISRYTSNEHYIELLKKMDLNNSIIHIFSEGTEKDFEDIVTNFPNNNFVMHISKEIKLTFHHLVMADVLVLSKSSFSYCAGLLNTNKKIANFIKSWWHKPLKSWEII
tara:strand:- start:2940 stop:4847 length:1908 start_codon:yes stop_codon:yes gene_type:complete